MKKLAFILLPLLLTTPAHASGGAGGPGGTGLSANYDIGKRVFFAKLYCPSCPLSDLELQPDAVAAVLPSLTAAGDLGRDLSFRERYAVRYFLKRRFDL